MNNFSNISKRVALWLSCVFIFSSCSLPSSGSASSLVWLDQPTTNSLLPLAPFTLKAHARGGVTRIEFLVNNVPVGSFDTDSNQTIVYAETSWNPSAGGSYMISARALAGNISTLSETATVCVSDTVSIASAGFSGDCASPIAGAGEASSDPISVIASVNDNPMYYGNCNPHILTVKANLRGDLATLNQVQVSWMYDTVAGTSPFGLGDVPFDHNDMTLQPDGTYLWTSDLNTAASGWGLTGSEYMIDVYVTAWDGSMHGLGTTGPVRARWLSCSEGLVVTPTFTAAPAPRVITPTLTAVPAPAVITSTFTSIPIPVDTTAPDIAITQVNPSDVGYYITGCGPNSITVQANVTDASGISNVILTYQYSTGISSTLPMSALGGGNYQAALPLDMNTYNTLLGVTGSVSFTVNATDSNGNTGNASGGPVTLMYCPG